MTLVMSVTRIEDLAKCKKDLIKILILQFHASSHQKINMSIQLISSNLTVISCLLEKYQFFLRTMPQSYTQALCQKGSTMSHSLYVISDESNHLIDIQRSF